MTTNESWVCVVCGDTEDGAILFEVCGGCGETYHYNQTSGPGKDCGAAWIEDEETGMIFFCNTCMDAAREEDQRTIADITAAAAAGTVTPDMLVQLMATLQKTGVLNDQPIAGFPGFSGPGAPTGMPPMPGMPAGMGVPGGPISAADLSRMFGQPLPTGRAADGDEDAPAVPAAASDAPPLVTPRRTQAERRYRRIK